MIVHEIVHVISSVVYKVVHTTTHILGDKCQVKRADDKCHAKHFCIVQTPDTGSGRKFFSHKHKRELTTNVMLNIFA